MQTCDERLSKIWNDKTQRKLQWVRSQLFTKKAFSTHKSVDSLTNSKRTLEFIIVWQNASVPNWSPARMASNFFINSRKDTRLVFSTKEAKYKSENKRSRLRLTTGKFLFSLFIYTVFLLVLFVSFVRLLARLKIKLSEMFLSDKLCHKLQLESVYPNHKRSNFNVQLARSLIYISHRLLMLLKVRANIVFLDFHVNS